jgi:hypothetical protein
VGSAKLLVRIALLGRQIIRCIQNSKMRRAQLRREPLGAHDRWQMPV